MNRTRRTMGNSASQPGEPRWTLSVVMLALVATTLWPGCRTLNQDNKQQQAEQHWNEVRGRFKHQLARQQYAKGLFQDAVMTAADAISLDAKEVGAFVVLARANLELGKVATADAVLQTAANLGLDSPEMTYTQGVILEQRGDLDGALAHYRQARSRDGTAVHYLLAEAECLVSLDRHEEALALLDESGGAYDDRASVNTLAAHIALRLHDDQGATERYRSAMTEQRASRTIPRELGLLLAQHGRCELAITVLQPLLDDASSLKQNRDREGAENLGDEGLIRRTLSACYLQLGAHRMARDTIADHAARHPDDALAQLLLAKATLALDDLITASRAVDLARGAEPHRTELWLVQAVLHWRRGDFASAAESLYDVLANHPDDVDALCLLAEVLKATHRSEGARGYFQRALEVDPNSAWARAGLTALAAGDAKFHLAEPPSGERPQLTAIR